MHGFEALKKAINETKSAIALHMVNGGCRNMEEYARQSGKHEAYESVLDEIRSIEKRYVED